jgi:hypothetical protein
MYKSRGNAFLDRTALYGAIGDMMAEPEHSCGGGVSLASPDCVIMCQMVPTAHGAGGGGGGAAAAAGSAAHVPNTVCGLAVLPAEKLTEIRGGSINVANLSGGSMEQDRVLKQQRRKDADAKAAENQAKKKKKKQKQKQAEQEQAEQAQAEQKQPQQAQPEQKPPQQPQQKQTQQKLADRFG